MLLRTALASVLVAVSMVATPAQGEAGPAVTIAAPLLTKAEDGATALLLAGRVTGDPGADFTVTPVLGGHIGSRSELVTVQQGSAAISGEVVQAISGKLSAKGVASWTATVPISQTENGVLGVGVQLQIGSMRAQASTAVAWFPQQTDLAATEVTLAIPLSAAPYTDDSELLRLDQLLNGTLAGRADVTWLLDPALGPWLATQDSEIAISIATKLGSLNGQVLNLPYGLANIPALVAGGSKRRVLSVTGGITLAPVADLDSGDWVVPAVYPLVSNAQLLGSDLATTNVVADIGKPAVVWDAASSACLANGCAALQVAMMTAEQPGRSRHVLLLAPIDATAADLTEVVDDIARSNWAQLVPLDMQEDPTQLELASTPIQVPALAKSLLKAVDQCVATAGLVALVTQAAERPDPGRCRLAYSTTWPDSGAALDFTTSLKAQMSTILTGLSVQSARTVLVGTEAVEVPVTIRNAGSVTVQVSATVTSEQPLRLTSTQSEQVGVAPGQQVTVVVPVTVRGTGDLRATAAIVASDGTPIGSSAYIVLRPTAYTRVAGLVAGAALIAMVLLMINGIRKRRRS